MCKDRPGLIFISMYVWFAFVIALRVWSLLLLLLLNVFYVRLSKTKTKTTTRQIPPFEALRLPKYSNEAISPNILT